MSAGKEIEMKPHEYSQSKTLFEHFVERFLGGSEKDSEKILQELNSIKSPAAFLTQYGLKTAKSVEEFDKTTAGRVHIDEMIKELFLEKEIEEHKINEQIQDTLLMKRIQVAFLLAYLAKKEHISNKIKEFFIEEIKHSQERLTKSIEQAQAQTQKNQQTDKEYYDKMESALQEYKSLDETLMQLSKLSEKITAKYEIFKKLPDQDEIQRKIDLSSQDLNDPEQKKSVIKELSAPYIKEMRKDYIEKRIQENPNWRKENPQWLKKENQNLEGNYETEIRLFQDEIQRKIDNDEDPSDEINYLNALNLKLAVIEDSIAIKNNQRVTFKATLDGEEEQFILNKDVHQLMTLNDDGQLVEVNEKNAHNLTSDRLYVQKTNTNSQLVTDGKDVYLIPKNVDSDQVQDYIKNLDSTLKQNAKTAATDTFTRAKQEILTVKHVVNYHENVELQTNKANIQTVKDRMSQIEENNVRLLQSVRASANQNQSGLATAPHPTVSSSAARSQVPTLTAYCHNAQIEDQKNRLSKYANTPQARKELDQEFNQCLKNGKPLSPAQFVALEKRMIAFGNHTRSMGQNNKIENEVEIPSLTIRMR